MHNEFPNINKFSCVPGYEPYFNLICAIIESAIKDKDIKYLKSKVCKWHCELIGLEYKYLLRGTEIMKLINSEISSLNTNK